MLVLFESVFYGDDCTWSVSFENFHGIFSSQEKIIEHLISIHKEASTEFYYVDVIVDEIVNIYKEEDHKEFSLDRRIYLNKE